MPDVLVIVEAFLVGSGFVVVTAPDGDSALRIIASDSRIGLLVTDFAMPGLSGVDLIMQALQMRPNLKVLLITGYPHADGLAELPAGVTGTHQAVPARCPDCSGECPDRRVGADPFKRRDAVGRL